ncbi:ubiquinone/menaquinone biosynthesis methyltransferase [Desulfarculus baarsii DSM 2075]|uniref:Demethylmenaquinone methyltransferase n=1 Tax=Desulfarculus baarsii (strain ATCC 33931 / DSM 2075 / LMG 7858 / VKM B-1802 / 2st14) TaxID=644282 RepID=E1QMB7_DESB2|nr:ubiquinone/menaquinone biosynthesis methyltransferase [Desulfarculus baarsii]ADK86160.1 ubiquinone/menaquinone biosynthesis methyltransferase [Desulfarculus baarsii DSM 2075]
MRDPSAQIKQVKGIFSRVAPVYDLLNHVLSLGEDIRWRRFVARALRLGPTGRVLDVATGTGDLALAVAKRPERPLVVGLDLTPAMLGPARRKCAASGARVALLAGDGTLLPFADQSFDAVTCAFGVRNIPDRRQAMAEMGRVLVPGGRVYILEFTTPQSAWVRRVYLRYLRHLLPRVGGLISGDEASYRYLAETIMEFPSPAEFRGEMAAAGLIAARSHALTAGVAWVHVAERPLANIPR